MSEAADSSSPAVVAVERKSSSGTIAPVKSVGVRSYEATRYLGLNQDRYLSEKLKDGYIWAVFDGHCPLGETAAEIAKTTLLKECKQILSAQKKFGEADMKKVFEVMHKEILAFYGKVPKTYKYPGRKKFTTFTLLPNMKEPTYRCADYDMPLDFGTTAVVAVLCGNMLVVGNAGDSRAFLGVVGQNGRVAAVELSAEDNVTNATEVARIQHDFPGRTAFADGYLYPAQRETGHQLAVTRALGHRVLAAYGVISTPHIFAQQLGPTDRFLVLSSDGVSDTLDPHSVVNLAAAAKDAQQAADHLVKASFERSRSPPDDRDNTTALVVFF